MDKLVAATLEHGLAPPVVMEFPGLTTGGGFSGTSGESSSFRHGFFENTINWIEIVLGNGDIVTASDIDRPNLLYGAVSSYGTLGVTTLLEIRLIEAKTYVELTYHRVASVPEALHKIESAREDSFDYLDGILFAKDRGVVCIGRMTNIVGEGIKIQRFSGAQDPWFYCHAEEIIANSDCPTTAAIPLVDYLFRYDRGAFWAGCYVYAFQYFITPFNRVTRWALDSFTHTRVMYDALHKSGLASRYIVQDVAVPYHAANEFSQFLDQKVLGFIPFGFVLCN
jgi:Delta24-sterol reductase